MIPLVPGKLRRGTTIWKLANCISASEADIGSFTIDGATGRQHNSFDRALVVIGQNIQKQGRATYVDIVVALDFVHGLAGTGLRRQVNNSFDILQSLTDHQFIRY
jgi:hypothetical protein